MRVLHITDFFDPTVGYAEFYLAKKQVEKGLDVRVITFNYSLSGHQKWVAGFKTIEGINVNYLDILFKAKSIIWPLKPLDLIQIIKTFVPDLVHIRGLLSPLAQMVLLLKQFYRFSVVGDVITGISPLTYILLPKFKSFFNFWVSRNVDAFFVCNRAIEKFLVENIGISSSKTYFIPLAADHELFKPDTMKREKIRNRFGFKSEDVVAIYTGKFLPHKRIHDLLIASKSIIEKFQNFKIILVGDGPDFYKTRLNKLINELGIVNNVLFFKRVHRTELPNFYNAADIAVWPGTFSISIVEAMACALPIIIVKSDWTSHYLENKNGYFFKAGDINALRLLLLKLVQDQALREYMGKMSRKLINEKLSWNVVANEYIKVYKRVLNA